MFRNYLKIAFRNLLKHKMDSTINLFGLCLAFTSALLLFLSVGYEFSYDQFHENADRIYKPYIQRVTTNGSQTGVALPVPLIPALKAGFAEIEGAARHQNMSVTVEYNNKKMDLDLNCADPDFFKIFSFKLLKGSSTHAIDDLGSVVIRKGAAKAMFGDEEPMGKMIRVQLASVDGQVVWRSFVVNGVLEDAPANSSINYDLFTRFENWPDYHENKDYWNNWNHSAHLLLRAGVNRQDFERKSAVFMASHFARDIAQLKTQGVQPDANGRFMQIGLLPLSQYHFDNDLGSGPSVNVSYLYLLLTVGGLILLIAGINFVNLTIGRSFTRTREVGLRKTLGANPWQIALQFWLEVGLISGVAFCLSMVACVVLLPYFQQLFNLNLRPAMLLTPVNILTALLVFFVVTLLAGGYPVWLITRLSIADVLRGRAAGWAPSRLRNALMVAQFSIATLLMICTLIAWQQIHFLRSQPIGYNRQQLISIPADGEIEPGRVLSLMRHALEGKPGILSISGIYNNLGRGIDGSNRSSVMGFNYKGKTVFSQWMGISHQFAQTLGLQLVAGRDFSTQFASDSQAAVINQTMAAQLGEGDPIGVSLPVDSARPLKVIGVVRDFNFESLHQKIGPLTLVVNQNFPPNYVLVRVSADHLPEHMALLRQVWAQIEPDAPFQGTFVDENIERQYRSEERLGHMFMIGAGIAITLSCLGLLAIVMLVLAQRTKEIGIRKVLGASIASLVELVFRDFLKLVLVAIVISSPIAWVAASRWLEQFSYRVTIQWWVFALAGGITIAIAFCTVLTRALQAATANPVKSLRTE